MDRETRTAPDAVRGSRLTEWRRGASLALLAVACAAGMAAGYRHETARTSVPAPVVRHAFERGLDTLAIALDGLDTALQRGASPSAIAAFRAARSDYKHIETLLEAFAPTAVEALNGPPEEPSEDKPYVALGAPAGFQVIEAALFYHDDPGRDSLASTVRAMRRAVVALRGMTSRVTISDADLLDALRLEIARIATLGVAGFDAPQSGDAIVECAESLEGARSLVRAAAGESPDGRAVVPWSRVDSALTRAAAYLRLHSQFDSLNRLTFIVAYANPAAHAIADARRTLPAPPALRRLWRQSAASVYENGAFDASAFAPVDAPSSSAALLALGGRLFVDPTLSGPRTRSCAFCHDPSRAFTDGRARSALLTHTSGNDRNTPTLVNAGYAPLLFDDLRARSLEMQAGMVLASPTEMASSPELAAARLRRDPGYVAAFARAFPRARDRSITAEQLRLALGAYVRSLNALDSRFDRAVQGDTAALSPTERFGFTVFAGKARCATCHFLPLVNGTMPPDFVASEAEIIGTPALP
ncbi:MAG TPA: cytochrome c peroxidase, partial [Gemmatimonadaceae bacterium]